MPRSPQMEAIIEERHALRIYLLSINESHECDIFTNYRRIETLFGCFLKIPQYTEIATLVGHTRFVRCFTLHENKLYSGSGDNTIRIWNTETYQQIATLRGHTNDVNCLTLHENKLYSNNDNTIRIWRV